MKFLVDMGISIVTVDFLRTQGYDAVHLREQGLQRMQDSNILQKARTEQRVVLAHDLDFGDLLAASGAVLPSVIIFRLRDMRPANVNRHLTAVLAEQNAELEQGVIVIVTEGRIRMRRLPIGSQK
jgi:predicted nuclease of predicted toxin-antitoxin system